MICVLITDNSLAESEEWGPAARRSGRDGRTELRSGDCRLTSGLPRSPIESLVADRGACTVPGCEQEDGISIKELLRSPHVLRRDRPIAGLTFRFTQRVVYPWAPFTRIQQAAARL